MSVVKKVSIIALIGLALLSSVYFITSGLIEKNEKKDSLTIITYKTDIGYAYKILVDNKVYIKQEFIPVVSGKYGFCTEQDAQKTAELVKNKLILKGNPTLTSQDIKNLKIKVGCI